MPTWPATLPPPALNTLTESPPDNLLRSEMDKGPAKVRRRTTANPRPVRFTLLLTPDELQDLDDFYAVTTVSGAIAFDYTHPRTGQAVEARFLQPPEYSEREGVIYSAAVSLELLP